MRFAKKSWLLAALVLTGVQQDSSGQDQLAFDRVPPLASTPVNSSGSQSTMTTLPAPELPPASKAPPSRLSRESLPPSGTTRRPAPSPGCYFLNARSFTIPFTVDAAGAKPQEVQLYTSRGPTSPWTRVDGKPATSRTREFQFTGQEDGEFWFATRTIDSVGRAHPAGPIQPQLKVFVDTRKPDVVLEAEADASGRVDLKIKIDDASPLQVQLRYVTDTVRAWQQIPVTKLPPDGRLHFSPGDSWEQLSLQFVATDSAKNQNIVSKLLSRPRVAAAPNSRLAATRGEAGGDVRSAQFRSEPRAAGTPPTASDPVDRVAQNGVAPNRVTQSPNSPGVVGGYAYGDSNRGFGSALNAFRGATLPAQGQAIGPQAPPSQTPPSPVDAKPFSNAGFGRQFAPAAMPGALPLPATPAQISHGFGPPPSYPAQSAMGFPSQTLTGEIVPTPAGTAELDDGIGLNSPQQSSPIPETRPAPPATVPPSTARPKTPAEALRPLSPTRLAPDDLQGKVESIPAPAPQIDPQAARQTARRPVDVAITSGRVPIRYSDSVRFSLEFEVEAIGSAGVESIELYGSTDGGQTWKYWGEDPDRVSPFDIETKEEGVFGFRIVVVGRNGLTSPRPLPGETPDIAVVVDQVKPVVRISAAQYGQGDRIGSLVIRYECEDANLMQRPISLSFSDAVDGPWTTIAAGLRNEGTYVWPADPGLPRQMYLRIDAKDEAGNVGTYVLDRPIDAQGLAPRARIRGFQPLSAGESTRAGAQTARRPQPERK